MCAHRYMSVSVCVCKRRTQKQIDRSGGREVLIHALQQDLG
jgi:hypothetical protein